MISQAKIEANRKNAQKSTGPRTTDGKDRIRLNALKHGATAQTPVLPGEDPALFQARVDAYKADLQPRNTLESDLIERMALLSTQFDRVARVEVARAAERMLTIPALAVQEQEMEAAALGQRLFFDRRGPLAGYPSGTYDYGKPRTSWSDIPDDRDDPARLVAQLESTGPGCRWLLNQWAELRARLEAGDCWQSPEKLKAIRLLGRQPLDAADVREVTRIFLACHAIDPTHKHAFFELRCDLTEDEFKQYVNRLKGRNLKAIRPTDAAEARALLLGLVDRATGRLRPLAEAHRVRDEMMAALRRDTAAFDDSKEAERLRRHAVACDRGLHRILATIFKLRKEVENGECDPTEPEDAGFRSNGHCSVISVQDPTDPTDPTDRSDGSALSAGSAESEPTAASGDRQNEATADATNSGNHEPSNGQPQRIPENMATADTSADNQTDGIGEDGRNCQIEATSSAAGDFQIEPTDNHVQDREADAAAGIGDPAYEARADRVGRLDEATASAWRQAQRVAVLQRTERGLPPGDSQHCGEVISRGPVRP
jgi:hypothetical protein